MTKKIALIFLFLLTITSSFAQKTKNVTWNYSSKNTDNGNIELIFNAIIENGFHLYSPYNPQNASMPLDIKLTENPDFKQVGKIAEMQKPIEHFEEVFNETEKYFEHSASFKITIQPIKNQPFKVSGKIKGQVCNDQFMCSMVNEDFEIEVSPKTQKIKDEKSEIKDDSKVDNKLKQAENKKVETSTSVNSTETKIENKISENPDSAKNDARIIIASEKTENTTVQNLKDNNDITISDSVWNIFIIAFLAGLAAIFTPCVFPMIPMTVTFFLKDKSGKGKINAIIYGISIVLLYTLPVAILILISNLIGGENFTAGIFNALSTHWLPNIIFFIIFLIFALSFLGMFEIVLPSSIINKAEKRGDKGGLIGVFFLAFVLVLVSFSCTGPIVGSVLVESTAGNNFLKPITAMLGFSIAFALPFTLFAFFPEIMKKMPKSGGWLNTVKVVLGFVELALGLKFLSVADQTYHWHLLDREVYLSIWIALGILLAMYLLGKLKLPNDSDMDSIKVPRLMLAIVTLSFVIYMIPGLFGAPLKALAGYIPPITTQDFVISKDEGGISATNSKSTLCNTPMYSDKLHLPFGIEGYFEYNEALQCAKNQNKPVLLIFTGHGCVNCRKMEENVWSNPEVKKTMQNDFVICALFTDDRSISNDGEKTIGEINTELQISKYQINAQPYYVIIDPKNPDSPLMDPMSYNPDIDSFLKFLRLEK